MHSQKKQKFIDINKESKLQKKSLQKFCREDFDSVLFSRGKKTSKFFTEDSKLYITPREFLQIKQGIKLDRKIKKWESASSRIVNEFKIYRPSAASALQNTFEKYSARLDQSLLEVTENCRTHFSVVRLWNLSIVGSVLFGMVIMTFVYRYLGQGAAADQHLPETGQEQQLNASINEPRVLAASTSKDEEAFADQVLMIEQTNNKKALEEEIREMVKGYPIEKMVPYIAEQDRTVAAFIVGIAKKESAWGKRVPVLNGQDCYNYWGYRGKRKLMGTGGHTCFNSPEDAVETVAKRISQLVEKSGKDTPAKMVSTWKCGTSCKGDKDAQKWVTDVAKYFNKIDAD